MPVVRLGPVPVVWLGPVIVVRLGPVPVVWLGPVIVVRLGPVAVVAPGVDIVGPVPVVKADVETVVPGTCTVVWLGSMSAVTVVAVVLIAGVNTPSEIKWQMFTQSIIILMLEL